MFIIDFREINEEESSSPPTNFSEPYDHNEVDRYLSLEVLAAVLEKISESGLIN